MIHYTRWNCASTQSGSFIIIIRNWDTICDHGMYLLSFTGGTFNYYKLTTLIESSYISMSVKSVDGNAIVLTINAQSYDVFSV